MEKKFVVYRTIYSGDRLPKYYIGSTSLEKIKSGYYGSVRSKKYKDIFYSELKLHPNLFSIEILSYHDSRNDALSEELLQQIKHNVVESDEYFNESFASINGYFGRHVNGINHPKFGLSNYKIWINKYGLDIANEKLKVYLTKQSISNGGKNNPMFGRNKEVVAIDVNSGLKVRVNKVEFDNRIDLSGHTLGYVTVIDKSTGKKITINKSNYNLEKHLHHNTNRKHNDTVKAKLSKIRKGLITAKDWDGNFYRVSKDDPRFESGELSNIFSKRWIVVNNFGEKYNVMNIKKFMKSKNIHFHEKIIINSDGSVTNHNVKKYNSLNGWNLKCLD